MNPFTDSPGKCRRCTRPLRSRDQLARALDAERTAATTGHPASSLDSLCEAALRIASELRGVCFDCDVQDRQPVVGVPTMQVGRRTPPVGGT